jgi:hypothetical protein
LFANFLIVFRIKSKLHHPSASNKPIQSIVSQYVCQIQGLEDEVAELHTRISNISNQLHSCRQEADRWRILAEDRLKNMGDLRERQVLCGWFMLVMSAKKTFMSFNNFWLSKNTQCQ